ncbi:MAG: hypothetical protein NZM28_02500 [Fimbriimonadales bacterium]|nr:hypothetical protein [Fimbriimonadales bacterium]
MAMRRPTGKVHWVFLLFIALVAVFAVMALAPVVGEMRRPPYEAKAIRFMEHLRLNEFDQAAKLLDMQSVPKEKQDPKKAVEERMPLWGTIEKVSLVESIQSPADLKHPKASEGVRVDLHLQCYLGQGSASVYLAPQGGDWVIVDYLLQ